MTKLSGLLKDLKIAAVPHGFRSSFRDWAAEETNHLREVVEAALAHVVRNKVEAAYARSDLFERWRILMDDWATYLGPRDGEGFGALMITWAIGRRCQRPDSGGPKPLSLGPAGRLQMAPGLTWLVDASVGAGQ